MATDLLCAALTVATLAASAYAAPQERGSSLETRLERVTAYLKEEQAHAQIPGMSAAVVVGDRLVWARGFGLADVEHNVAATPRTVYRIASISKMVTAVAVLQLVQYGRLSLNASIRDYVPELPDKGERISVRHVLAHLSGIRHYSSAEERLSQTHYKRLVDTLEVFKDDPLVDKPGERFVYSTWAYNLLGIVIERVSGSTFDEHVKKSLFEPLGMTASAMDDPGVIIPHRARSYIRRQDDSLGNAPLVDLSVRYPGDGMVSTVEDLGGFAAAFLKGTVLNASVTQIMTTEHKTSSGEPTRYGLGCFVRELDGRKIIGHAGTTPQASACLLIVPGEKLAVVLLANLARADVTTMSLDMAKILLDNTDPKARVLPERATQPNP
ncbi:MAG: serine hydrolase domain-containing protein [Planctomycetota bacterium]|jgi:CubicO group peptidase (beta-lactamase class C family)